MTTDLLRPERSGMGSILVARQRFALLASLCIVFALSEWLFWFGSAYERTPWWVSAIFPVFMLVAASQCFRTAAKLVGGQRRAWLLFGIGCSGMVVGETIWGVMDSYMGFVIPVSGLMEIFYVVFPVSFIVGIWYYRVQTPSTDDAFIQIGNLGIIFSATLLMYIFAQADFLGDPIPTYLGDITVFQWTLNVSATLFALIILSLHSRGRRRHVMSLVFIGLCFNALADLLYLNDLMGAGYQVSSLWSGPVLVCASFIIWAAFEQRQMKDENVADEPSAEAEARAKQWESLLPPLAFAGVLMVALFQRDKLVANLIPYVMMASLIFIGALAMRNWWGHRLEIQLRGQALQSKSEVQLANRELKEEMKTRALVQEELRQSQKMDALGQLTGGVAHDFNNLLAVVLGNLELLEHKVPMNPNETEFLHDATEAARRGSELTQRLLATSRKQALRPEPIEVDSLLEDTKKLLARTLGERIRVTISGHKNVWLCLADRAQLENAVLNLALNARDAMPDGGEIEIKAANITLDEMYAAEHPDAQVGSFVALSVRDSGVGIPAEILSRVFEPFFTTKKFGSGTGLGLSMVYGFAKQSGGHVTIESRVGSGTAVTLYLPSSKTHLRSVRAESRPDHPQGSGESILLVEDEPAVRKLVSNVLKELSYQITEARDGDEALALLEGIGSLDLLLSDVVLPGSLSGRDLATAVARQRPRTKILLMSGYAPEILDEGGGSASVPELLHKPFRTAELARKIRSVLESRESHADRAKTTPFSNSRFV